MQKDHNTPDVWNNIWDSYEGYDFKEELRREEFSIRWRLMESLITNTFGGFQNLQIVEIGAGRGLVTLLMCLRGAKGTVVDYSDNALKIAQKFYNNYGVEIKTVLQDARNLDSELFQKFDVSMSFGLVEHFEGSDRGIIFKTHYDLLKFNGISFISIPNSLCFPYRIFKSVAETLKIWQLGVEIPFSRKEIFTLAQNSGYTFKDIIGSPFSYSVLKYLLIDPLSFLSRRLLMKDIFKNVKMKPELSGTTFRRSYINDHFGYGLTFFGNK